MTSAYDVERFFTDLVTLLKANMNTKLSALDTEKNDYTIPKIDDGAWFFQTLNESHLNFNPCILYGVSNFEDVENPYGASAIRMLVEIVIIVADQGNDANIMSKMFRYQRALREVITDNFDGINFGSKLNIENQIPIDLKLLNSSYLHKAIGVTVKADIG